MKYISPTKVFASVLLTLVASSGALAQKVEQSSLYVSEVDTKLTVRRITVLPFADNLGGIYSRPLEGHVIELLKKNHRFDYLDSSTAGPILSTQELSEDSEKVRQLTATMEADAFIASSIFKGPAGIMIELNLYLKTDGKLLAQSLLKDYSRFEIQDLKEQMSQLLAQLINKIPYNGVVLSRQNNRVTINLGKKDGLEAEKVVSAIQIIKAERHPKFNFLISTEKEILGKIKILKVEDALSFGRIITEKEKGAIQKNTKISGLEFVNYPTSTSYTNEEESAMAQRADTQVSFGKDAEEWVPLTPPSFGQVGLRLGAGNFAGNLNVPSISNMSTKAMLYPSIYLDGELWITSNWIVRASIRQAILTLNNPRSGSSPSELSGSLGTYKFIFGYSFLSQEDFWGPKAELMLGYMNSRLFVDDSDPRSLTTMDYSGLLFGIKGSLPVTEDRKWSVGAEFQFSYRPKLSEKPTSSGGSSNNNINLFGFFAQKKLRENLRLIGGVEFEIYTSSFSGVGGRGASEVATSSSQKHMGGNAGLSYLF